MPTTRLLVAEFMDPQGIQALRAHGQVRYRPELGEDREGLLAAVRGLSALVVRNRCQVDEALLEAAGPSLRVVGRLGAGLDNVELAACQRRGVRVVYARGANAQAVCEYVLGGLLYLLRRLAEADAAVRAGRWPREALIGGELAGRTLGLVGVGEVGRRLARQAHAFGVRVLGTDPVLTAGHPLLAGVPVDLAPLDQLLEAADILSLHLPLTPGTWHMVDAGLLARMRPGSILVQASRGGIVDENALADAVRSGHLGGAILDVRETEPPPSPDPLADLPGVLLTPHLAGLTHEAQARVGAMVAEDVGRVLRGDAPRAEATPF